MIKRNININEIMDFVQNNIPLSNHLGISINEYKEDSLSLNVSLKENKNHHNSAFGGSLSAIAILNSWVLLHAKLEEMDITNSLVIQNSNYTYKKPILGDFKSIAILPSNDDFDKFIKLLEKKGKARIKILCEVYYNDEPCGFHEGSYVAIKEKS